ncbi:MAG: M3 family metallopeptidase [Thermoplasmata archaeon]
MDIEKIRKDMEAFNEKEDEEYYLNWSGQKDDMDLTSIYKEYEHLFTSDTVKFLKSEAEGASGEDKRRLRQLYAASSGGFLQNAVKELTDKKEQMEATKVVKVDGEEIPYRFSVVKLLNSDDRDYRQAIYDGRNMVIDEINPVLRGRVEEFHNLAVRLGYPNYMEMMSDIKVLDFHSLTDSLDVLMSQTARLYEEKMEKLLSPIGIPLAEAEKHDIAYLLRAKEFDPYFRKEEAVPALKRTLLGIGIDLDKQPNIILDTEERKKKSPRAFCAPIKIPQKIMLVIMPQGGVQDFQALFHEAGHAEHHGLTVEDCSMEYKWLGDKSVSETYAFILEYLSNDRNWLKRYIPMDDYSSYLEFAYLTKLFFLRRYSAKLKYEMQIHTKGVSGMDEVYKKTLEDALVFRHPPNHYLNDMDDGFYTAQYLRAWIFEAQLRAVLQEKFGDEWFLDSAAGDYLKDLWATGQKYDIVELAQMIGYSGLDINPLVDEIVENLG